MNKRIKKKTQKEQIRQEVTLSKSFFTILKEWLTWQKAGVILTGLSIMVAIVIAIWPTPKPAEKEILRKQIISNIEIIENTFKQGVVNEDDSLMQKFKQQSIEIAVLWRAIDETIPHTEFVDKGVLTLKNVLEHEFARQDKYMKLVQDFIALCLQIREHEVLKGNGFYSILNYSKLNETLDNLKAKQEIEAKHRAKSIEYLNEGLNLSAMKKDPNKVIRKAMEELESMKNEPGYYTFDNMFFDFIVETNRMYQSQNRNDLKDSITS